MGLLSWWRERGQSAADSGEPAAAPADTAPPVREAPAWTHLPPLQRTLEAPGVTIDPTGFQGSLTTRQDTALGTPLGHLVDPEAPSGLGHGIISAAGPVANTEAVPTPSAASSSDASSSVQRSIAFPAPPSTSDVPTITTVPLQRATPSAMIESTRLDVGPALEVPYAPAPDGGFDPAPRGGGDAPPPAPSVQTAQPVQEAAAEPGPGPGSSAGPAVSPDEPSAPVPPSMPVQRAHRGDASDARPHSDSASMTFRPGRHVGRMPLGFGEPLTELPPTAQRSAAARSGPDAPLPAPGSTPTDAEAPDVRDAGGSEPVHLSEPPPVAPLLGDNPVSAVSTDEQSGAEPPSPTTADVQRTVSMPGRADASDSTSDTRPSSDVTWSTAVSLPPSMLPPASPLPVAPLVAQRSVPLYSGVEIPSAPAGGRTGAGGSGTSARGTSADAPAVVPVRWESADTKTAPRVQRSASESAKPDASPPSWSPTTNKPAGPAPTAFSTVQRSLGAAPATGGFTHAGDAAIAAGVGRRAADGSVVFDHLTVQREEEGEVGVEPEPPEVPVVLDPVDAPGSGDVQPPAGLPPEGPGTPGDSGAAPGSQDDGPDGTPGSESGAGPPGDGKPPVVTDELVRALYPPLSRMLRADLRLERERAGFLIDTRH